MNPQLWPVATFGGDRLSKPNRRAGKRRWPAQRPAQLTNLLRFQRHGVLGKPPNSLSPRLLAKLDAGVAFSMAVLAMSMDNEQTLVIARTWNLSQNNFLRFAHSENISGEGSTGGPGVRQSLNYLLDCTWARPPVNIFADKLEKISAGHRSRLSR